jgi:hypothetical protein
MQPSLEVLPCKWGLRSGAGERTREPGALERWSVGTLERWSIGALERWSIGALEHWSIGALERWSVLETFRPRPSIHLLSSSQISRVHPVGCSWLLAPWLPGSLAPWLPGSLAPWLPGSLAPWLLGSLADYP